MIYKSRTREQEMYFGASPKIIQRASELRKIMTPAEKALWQELRNRKIANAKFRRQHPVKYFVLDFFCYEKRLAIELDGSVHDQEYTKERDINRTCELEQLGIKVIRFSNDDIFKTMNEVLQKIKEELVPT